MGPYIYDNDRKNAVSQIDISQWGQIQDHVQQVNYNHFNSASEIKNLDDELRVNLEFGPDDQRRMVKYWDDSGAQEELIKTRFYAGAYEKQINADLTKVEVRYISAGGQLVAMFVLEDGEDVTNGEYFFPHQDHLGSIIHITDETGAVVYTQSFDPWGRNRNPNDLTYDNISSRPDWLWRGYTGHEHLDEFGLINMNGRLYDPVVGRMLSPDNYVQNPDFTQSYNRYSYVWNNPLKYTDPSGEFIHGTLITMVFDFLATVFVHGGIDPTNTSENRNEAWKNFDPSANWSKSNQALQIDLGRFRTDPNRSTGGQIFQIFNRFTREVPQTELGNTLAHIRNISGSVDNVDNFGGATVVDNSKGDGRWGLTLGPYINTSRIGRVDEFNNLLMHEYGHVLQSETAGDLYLSKVAIPSGLSGLFDYNLGFDHDHDRTWFEISANQRVNRYLGKHYTSKGKPSVKDYWYEEEYPTDMDQIEWNWFVLFNPFTF